MIHVGLAYRGKLQGRFPGALDDLRASVNWFEARAGDFNAGNFRLYIPEFLQKLKKVITPEGCIAYWLSEPAPKFKKRLIKAGFLIEEHASRPHEKSKRSRHCLLVAGRRWCLSGFPIAPGLE